MPNPNDGFGVDVLYDGTTSTSGAGSAVAGFDASSQLVAQLEVTAASGLSPTLNVVLEDSLDGVSWNTLATFTQATGVGRSVQRVTAPFTNQLRTRHTVAGTAASFTFSVKVYSEA